MTDKPITKITSKIVSYSVSTASDENTSSPKNETPVKEEFQRTIMNELIERPETLVGRTYKIEKSPASEHAMYVTINDIVLDAGTEYETRRPFEIFINSKNMEQFQWVVAMTRIISAVFRKGGDVSFLAEEMKAVFDPKGGYFKKGGYVPSLVAEIGQIIEKHLQGIGIIEAPSGHNAMAVALISEKSKKSSATVSGEESSTEGSFPPSATLCNKCFAKSVIVMDGCQTCLNCGQSKCG